MSKKQTFKNRLRLLMKGEKPYTWARKVGIDKGLFQYYWQKEKIPTYDNLLKIQNHTGCCLNWLLTGKSVVVGQKIDGLETVTTVAPRDNLAYVVLLDNLSDLYARGDDEGLCLLKDISIMRVESIRRSGKRKLAAV